MLINRPAHNSGLAKAAIEICAKLNIRYAAFAKPQNVSRHSETFVSTEILANTDLISKWALSSNRISCK